MFSLKKLFSKEDKFFSLLEASAEEGRASVKALAQFLKNPSATASLEEFLHAREKEQEIATEIDVLLVESYATPLDREDIEMLSRALYRVPKGIKKFAERYLICAPHVRDVSFETHIKMLETATDAVLQMVSELRKGPKLPAAKAHNDTLQEIEGEADKMMVTSLEQLYQGRYDPVKAVMLKDLFESVEKVFDRCRNVGNILFQIALKHS
jgi:uncharacterized protein Yka (UPF0111/DUF47 family)